ncbi:MAG: PP2C family serine/threonine-protein phosphatase [Candidatus Paceibacterota bacterium]
MLGDTAPQPNNKQTESKEKLQFKVASISIQSEDITPSHPDNQDTLLVSGRAFGVLDGMGGEKGGKRASELARYYILQHLSEVVDGTTVEKAVETISKIFIGADGAIEAEAEKDPSLEKMGTTAVLIKFFRDNMDNEWALIPNVGDSRAYKIEDGKAIQLTEDDDFFKHPDILQFGFTKEDEKKLKEEIENAKAKKDLNGGAEFIYSRRHIVGQCLGHGHATPNVTFSPARAGDTFVLVTDFYENYNDAGFQKLLEEAISGNANLDEAAKKIIDACLEKSKDKENFRAKKDDMSIVIVRAE